MTKAVLILVFVIFVMPFVYLGLSMCMPLILWILMSIAVIVGIAGSLKNAFKAARKLHGKGVK